MTKKTLGVTFPSIESRRYGLMWSEDYLRRQIDQYTKEDHSKLLFLCQDHGIQPGPIMFMSCPWP